MSIYTESKELSADPAWLFDLAEATARLAAGWHAQMGAEEAKLRASIAWARFAHKGYLAVLEDAENSSEAREFVDDAREHYLRAERHLRRQVKAFIASHSRISQQ